MQDSYYTLESENEGLYREKGSKFLAYAFPCDHADLFSAKMDLLRRLHPKARHFCFAYSLDIGGQNFRYSDDGEPSGSAGLPIFNQLRSNNLHKAAVIVVRYFGGKKLGVPGLIHAYKTASAEALDSANIIEKFIEDHFKISFAYDQTGFVMRALDEEQATILENGYTDTPFIVFSIRQSRSEIFKYRLFSYLLNRSQEDITGEELIPGFIFEKSDRYA